MGADLVTCVLYTKAVALPFALAELSCCVRRRPAFKPPLMRSRH